MKSKVFSFASIIVVVVCALLASIFSGGKYFALFSILAAFAVILPFFESFERKAATELLALAAVMTGISVAGRFLFAPLPFFKPVTAIVIVTGMSLGRQCGFMTGALSALVSNIYFGQGPWTPFQMLSWGIIGFLAGVFSEKFYKSKVFLYIYGGLSGIVYSLIMDCWSVLWIDGKFIPARFSTLVISAIPVTASYMISNIIFLFLIGTPLCRTLSRIVKKYGLKLK